MRLQFGGYSFPVGQVEVLPSMRTQRDESGRPYQYDWTIIVRGMLLSIPGQDPTTAALAMSNLDYQLRIACSLIGRDLVLYDDSNRATSINFTNTISAVNPVQCLGFEYPNGGAGEYVTKREFVATFTVSYAADGRAGTWIAYQEQVQIIGNGGPLINWQPSVNGSPVPVMIYPETTIRVIISGSATGYNQYPSIPPGPLPVVFLKNPQTAVSERSPKFMGNSFAQYREFPVTWNYIYEGLVSDLRPNLLVARPWPVGR